MANEERHKWSYKLDQSLIDLTRAAAEQSRSGTKIVPKQNVNSPKSGSLEADYHFNGVFIDTYFELYIS